MGGAIVSLLLAIGSPLKTFYSKFVLSAGHERAGLADFDQQRLNRYHDARKKFRDPYDIAYEVSRSPPVALYGRVSKDFPGTGARAAGNGGPDCGPLRSSPSALPYRLDAVLKFVKEPFRNPKSAGAHRGDGCQRV